MARLINIGFGNVVNSQQDRGSGKPGCGTCKENGAEHQGNPVTDRCNTGAKDKSSDRHKRRLSGAQRTSAGDHCPEICRNI